MRHELKIKMIRTMKLLSLARYSAGQVSRMEGF